MTEKEEIIQAMTEFSEKMLTRMLEKYEAGHKGWKDSEKISSRKLRNQIHTDLSKGRKEIDIANRAMILWYRKEKKRNENI